MERNVLDVNIVVADKDTYDGVWLFYKLYSTLCLIFSCMSFTIDNEEEHLIMIGKAI